MYYDGVDSNGAHSEWPNSTNLTCEQDKRELTVKATDEALSDEFIRGSPLSAEPRVLLFEECPLIVLRTGIAHRRWTSQVPCTM